MTRRGADYRDNRWPGGADRGRPHRRRDRPAAGREEDRKSTRLNSSHSQISYAVFCLKKKKDSKYVHLDYKIKADTVLVYPPATSLAVCPHLPLQTRAPNNGNPADYHKYY